MENHLKVARALTDLLENKFSIGNFRLGLDPIIGMIPGFGDFITVSISIYLIWIAIQLRLPPEKLTQMVSNIITDFIIGILPVVGDIGDIFFKSNSRNMAIIEEFIKSKNVVEAEVIAS